MGFLAIPGYPDDLPGSLFVCDVVGNLVHRDVLVEEGPVFQARRSPSEQAREFFASHDNACRPIGVECGPDGALYLIDIQRDVIEHPDYIPEKVKAKLDLRAGSDRGRIYRITPRGGLPARRVDLGSLSHRDLVKEFAHSNGWWRATAQRLLIERHATDVETELRALIHAQTPPVSLAALHAAWTLQGLGRLREEDLLGLLRSPVTGLRENGLLLSEELASPGKPVRSAVLSALADPHPRVRFQAALTLGLRGAPGPEALEALRSVWQRDAGWRWSRIAVLTAVGPSAPSLLEQLLADREFVAGRPGLEDSFRELGYVAGRRVFVADLGPLERIIRGAAAQQVPATVRLATLTGLNEGLGADPKPWKAGADLARALEEAAAFEDPPLRKACWQMARRLGLAAGERQNKALAAAAAQAVDPGVPLATRKQQVALLELGDPAETRPVLLRLLDSREPAELQREALQVLRLDPTPEVATSLLQRWRSLSPSLRPEVADGLSSRRPWHGPLLDALERGWVKAGELNLDLEQRRHLLRHSTPENKARAARFFGDEEYSNRRKLVEDWLPRVPQAGDVARGREVFARLCAPCHQSGDLGNAVGPNLSDLSHRSVEDLVSNILDPNMAVNPVFATVSCETRDGELVLGVMDSENADTVVLRQPGGLKRTLPRSTLTRVEFTSSSLMPEGLEANLSPQELRDVVAFLQGHP
jgi:putative heme-binding domain-containing protein